MKLSFVVRELLLFSFSLRSSYGVGAIYSWISHGPTPRQIRAMANGDADPALMQETTRAECRPKVSREVFLTGLRLENRSTNTKAQNRVRYVHSSKRSLYLSYSFYQLSLAARCISSLVNSSDGRRWVLNRPILRNRAIISSSPKWLLCSNSGSSA